MKLKDIYEKLDELSPFELQEKWDNSGIQVGSPNQEIEQIVLSIDADAELLESLKPNTLLITHHPIIFGGITELNFETYPSNFLKTMIEKNVSNIAMHTNFDKTHLNKYVAEKILGYKILDDKEFVIKFEVNEDFDTFAKKVGEKFSLKNVKSVKCRDFVKTCALTTGSGGSMIKYIDADCFLTGDIKYHDAMEAKSINLSLIDIGHFESECFFSDILHKHLKVLGLDAIISSSKNPFTYI
ncbi:Nif3-like dinuclear metal center hexameric protein [Sulfurimonas lithotrophica]|uniref:GTP cyclohydrolase 1 type 2 homolog n=1 Tax=Sulfurimonas lithotrophica TaxID=2590022 RepID=A0A5P8NZ63_9BACT|nr:Nif3-like dinuclear metal center hexameric protein [Sulfurimonas lithotrophica]QFR48743.1 Nif3-like dinuclear metal center hexameric protein [Sulfurimonas lithotrophica]